MRYYLIPENFKELMQIHGVQMKINLSDFTLDGFKKHIEEFFKKTNSGDFLVFPEETGLLPVFNGIRGKTIMEAMMNTLDECTNNDNKTTIQKLFLDNTNNVRAIFSKFSKEYSIYSLSCGDFVFDEKTEIVNRCIVYDPVGREIFYQDKINLTKEELDLGISPGKSDEINILKIGQHKVAVAISLDAFVPSYVSRMSEADLILQPDANPNIWNSYLNNGRWQPEEWMDSSYYIAQRLPKNKITMNPMLTGNFFEINFQGQSSICKKAESSDNKMAYTGNEPTTGFYDIFEVKGYRKDEKIERESILGEKLDFGEGLLSVDL